MPTTTRAMVISLLGLVLPQVSWAATQPPPVITANNQVAQCRNPTVSVWINPTLTSVWDPLPVATFSNRITADNPNYPSNKDPDLYPYGTRNVTINACDHATPPNCSSKVISVNVQDTLVPTLFGGTNKVAQCLSSQGTPRYVSPATGRAYCLDTCNQTCPACTNPSTASTSVCTSCQTPCLAACTSNPNWVSLDRPKVSDVCDPNPQWTSDTPPAIFPIGTTTLKVTGSDFSGNSTVQSVTVQVVDTQPPSFSSSAPPFSVVSHASNPNDPLYCQYCQAYSANGATCTGGTLPGTLILLPQLNATDTCTLPPQIVYSWNLIGKTNPTPQNPLVCVPDTGSSAVTVQFIATDASGNTDTCSQGCAHGLANAPTTTQLRVNASSQFPLTLAVTQQSSGYVRQGHVNVKATNNVGAVTWAFVGAGQPDTPVGNSNVVSATFSTEGNYCPLYVSASDANGSPGATPYTCFGVDKTVPTHSFSNIPTTSAWPNSGTPVFSHGTALPLQITASDANGALPSGVLEVKAVVVPTTGPSITVYDNTFTSSTFCTPGANGALPTCSLSHYVAGCNKGTAQGGSSLCTCTAVDSTGECSSSGRLDLSTLSNGSYTLQITVTDFASNTESQSYPFMVTDLGTAFSNNGNNSIVTMLTALANNPTTPVAALTNIATAINYAKSAGTIFSESPGQAFLLANLAYAQLTQAASNGANVGFYQNLIASLVEGEVRKIFVATQARVQNGNLTAWNILGDDPNHLGYDPNIRGVYRARQFLVKRGGVLRDYVVNPTNTIRLAGALMSLADQQINQGQSSQALSTAVSVLNNLSTLYLDSTFAGIYGRAVHTVYVGGSNPNTIAEGYFNVGPPSHFGAETALVVSQQLQRFATLASGGALYGISPTVLTALNTANTSIGAFAAQAQIIQSNDWNTTSTAGFNNQKLTQNVYLNAVNALQALQTVQGGSIYTQYWQTGLGLTLADIVNFSMYEGPTALACILWGNDSDGLGDNYFNGCARNKATNAPLLLNMSGQSAGGVGGTDWEAEVAECRYNQMMYALADNRITGGGVGAVDLFSQSKCLIIDLYNRYYGNRVPRYLNGDGPIDPVANGCPATAPTYAASPDGVTACGACAIASVVNYTAVPDNTCNGVDDDCNGLVDDGVPTVTCGCGSSASQNASSVCPCAAQSACIDGQALGCVPGVAPSAVDGVCNGVDENCNGQINEQYVPTSCGVGGCVSYSTCNNGSLTACVPKSAQPEVCDRKDNNCNILVDEGLDNDNDGYGCPPCSSYTTQVKCSGVLGCSWSSSTCVGLVTTCLQCDPTVQTCPAVGNANSLLCPNDKTGSAWTGLWDCDDTDPARFPGGTEVCDGKDNNCNGQVDEGVKNACGNCDPSCTSTAFGSTGAPFTPTPNNSQNVALQPNTNALGLTTQALNAQFAWVSNDTNGTVSKIDTVTGKEVARYCQALKTGVTSFAHGVDPTGAAYDTRAEPTVCAGCGGCNRGSRTAVDKAGNVYIANRAHSPTAYQGTYSKIAANVTGCVDVNGDGVIETSRDVNGDGIISQNPNLAGSPNQEYFGELDECILWTRKPTQWVGTAQPSCNQPSWPPNNNITDPNNVTFTDERSACQADPNSYYVAGSTQYGVCQWTNACLGNGDSSCSTYTTQATCDPNGNGHSNLQGHWCTWTAACTGASGCSSLSNQTACTANPNSGCTWTGGCGPTACSVQNSNKLMCNHLNGCSWYQDCFNVGQTPYSTYVGPIIPRAVAIDAQGAVWVGLYNRNGMMQVDPATGYVTRWVYTGHPPYGAAIDKNGILWHTMGCCGAAGLMSINTNPNTITYVNPDNGNVTWKWTALGVSGPTGYINTHPTNPGNGSYGIAIDGLNRVYLGSYPSLTDAGYQYDSARNTWRRIPVSVDPNGNRLKDAGIGRGITVDASGNIWIAQHGDGGGRITEFNPNTLLPVLDIELAPKAVTPIGVGVGYGGKIWTNNQSTSNVAVVDPQSGAFAVFPVGGQPYTYSDFTGSILRTFTAPSGTYSEIVNACYGFQVNAWVNLVWNGITPVGTTNQGRAASTTQINFRVRGANTLVTTDVNGNPVDPGIASQWSLWFPDDISDPSKNASDPNRVYYYTLKPSAQWPTTGPCAGVQSVNGTYVTGCADLTSLPTTYTWNASAPNQPMAYVQVQAQLVSDGDNSVQPTLVNFQIARTCPQF